MKGEKGQYLKERGNLFKKGAINIRKEAITFQSLAMDTDHGTREDVERYAIDNTLSHRGILFKCIPCIGKTLFR